MENPGVKPETLNPRTGELPGSRKATNLETFKVFEVEGLKVLRL